MNGIVATVAALAAAYPRQQFPEDTQRMYVRMLSDLDEAAVAQATERLIRRSAFLPSISEIRMEVSEAEVGLPSAAEAWEIAQRGDLLGAPPEVRAAAESAGGRWTLIHSERPETVRAQFVADYESRRRRSLLAHAGAAALPLASPKSDVALEVSP